MGWTESRGVLTQDPSQAVSPSLAQGVCATEVLNPRVGKGKARVENQDDGA